MPVIEHKQRWFCIAAEEIYELPPTSSATDVAVAYAAPEEDSFRTDRFVFVWYEFGVGLAHISGLQYGDAFEAIRAAFEDIISNQLKPHYKTWIPWHHD